jgi:hypothetical protein
MGSRERDDPMAGLLKSSLAGDAGAGNGCPEPDILAAYFEHSLDREETAHVQLHLSQCARCREQLAALGRAEADMPAPAAHVPQRAPRASWLWNWRWLAPVATVLILTAVWATRRPTLNRIAEHRRQSTAPAETRTALQSDQRAPQPPEQMGKKEAVPAPSAVPTARKNPSGGSSDSANSVARIAPPSVESSPPQSLISRQSAGSLPLNGRNYPPSDQLSKSAPAAPASTAQASNTPARGRSQSVTVESEAPTVAEAVPGPVAKSGTAGGVGVPQAGYASIGGVAGDAASAKTQSSNAKEEPAQMRSFSARSEVTLATQAGVISTENIIPTPDVKILWRLASGGFVERSEDGGATWKGQLPDQNAHFVAGSAPGSRICWLVGDDGIILLTEDASNWQVIAPPVNADFVAINARNASTATVTTAVGRRFTTTNRGKSWKPAK